MDINFTEEQEIMRRSAADFLVSRCPKSLVREMVQDEKGYTDELWRGMADLGWMGLALPQEYGGAGGSFTDLVVLLEEMGRACLPGPFFSTVVLGGFSLLEAGNEQQKQELLPKIAKGEIVVTLAFSESETDYDPSSIAVTAKADGDSYIIDGTKLFVPDAHVADYILCAARTKTGAGPEDGITLFIVDSKTPGISCTLLKTIAGDKQCAVVFDKVMLPKENVLGEMHQGYRYVKKVLQKAAVAKCAEMAGGAHYVLDMSVSYAKERVQFNKPVGAFQAIQHHCADMLADADCCTWVTYKTAWMIDQGIPYDRQAAIAKAWCSDAYRRVVALGHQVIAGVGYILDHDMPLYFGHARIAEVAYGDADYHRKAVADEMYSQ